MNKFKDMGPFLIFIVVAVLIAVAGKQIIGTFKDLMNSLGLADSKEGKENKEYIDDTVNNSTALGTKSAWSPGYFRGKSGPLFTRAQGDKIAALFWDSVGNLYDTPSKGLAAVKMINNRLQLSWVAYCFSEKYKIDLLGWLNDKYDVMGQREYLRQILEYANNLPEK